MQNINIKFISISAGIGFVLSLFCGFFSHSSFLRILLVALLFAIVFAIIAILVFFLYNKFLNLDNPDGDAGYSLALAGNSKASSGSKADLVISELDLEPTGNNNHYDVGNNRQMLNESDYRSQQVIVEDSGPSGQFVPLRDKETVDNFSGTESVASGKGGNKGGPQFASMTDAGSAFSKAASSSSSLDLPDINNLNLSSGQSDEDSGSYGNEGEVLSDNTDFISSALKYSDDNAGNIQDASLMAKAISSFLSEET